MGLLLSLPNKQYFAYSNLLNFSYLVWCKELHAYHTIWQGDSKRALDSFLFLPGMRLLERPGILLRVVFSYFHWQKYKNWVSVHCSVPTKKLTNNKLRTLSILALKCTFVCQNRLLEPKVFVFKVRSDSLEFL